MLRDTTASEMRGEAEGAAQGRPASELADATRRSALYRAVWRWHFYAGLLSIPIIVLLALTGIVYLFRPQLNDILYGGMRNVEPRGQMVSYQQQMEAVQDKYPDAKVVKIGPPPSEARATEFDIDTGTPYPGFAAGNYTVFVDPYSGEVLGRRDNGRDPAQIAVQLHGSLMSGHWLGSEKWGDRLIELVASWTVVLVVTGVFLWWPRGRAGKSLKGTLIPRFNVRTARIKWRDVHAITGVLFAFVFIFFLLTGLAWTGVWGANYQKVATQLGSTRPAAVAQGVPSQKVGNLYGEGVLPWGSSALPLLPSSGASAGHEQHSAAGSLTWDPAKGAPLDAIVARAQQAGFKPGFGVLPPKDDKGSYLVVRGPDMEPAPNGSAFDKRSISTSTRRSRWANTTSAISASWPRPQASASRCTKAGSGDWRASF